MKPNGKLENTLPEKLLNIYPNVFWFRLGYLVFAFFSCALKGKFKCFLVWYYRDLAWYIIL